MSLINEALKKAEQARAGGLGESPAAPAAPVITKRGRTIGTRTLVLLGAMVILLIVTGALSLFWRTGAEPSAEPRSETVAKSKTTTGRDSPPGESAPAPAVASSPATAHAPTPATAAPASSPHPHPTPAVTPATEARSSAASSPGSATPNAATPGVVPTSGAASDTSRPLPATAALPPAAPAAAPPPTTPAVTAPPASATPRADERISEHLDRLRILGVRSPGPEARVLIGERVYRINDIVDRTLGLRLQSVDPGRITFVDPAGVTYTKNY